MRGHFLKVLKRLTGFSLWCIFCSTALFASLREVDLAITEIGLSKLAVDGQTLQVSGAVSVIIENFGIESIDAPFRVSLFEDQNGNGIFDADRDGTLGSENINLPLAAGQKRTVEIPVTGVVSFAGNLIYAIVDPENQIPERNETNNLAHTGLSCGNKIPPPSFEPILEWSWTSDDVEPSSNQIISTPIVVRLNDDNQDGRVDHHDVPDIVFVTTQDRSGNAGFSRGILRAIRGDSGIPLFSVTDPTFSLQAGAQIAAANIDADSLIEIIAVAQNGTKLIAFEHDGRFKWFSDSVSVDLGGPAIGDIDHDGVPEIVVGATILDHNGHLKARGTNGSTGRNGTSGPLSVIANIDLQGNDEIVTGNAAYRSDGSLLWRNDRVRDGFVAVGNLDDDPEAEIVAIHFGELHALEHTGELKWGPILIPGGGIGGAPTIADFDGDGKAEIGIAGARNYSILDANGKIKWSISTQDLSSSMTSSTIFDFEGDGIVEVIYNDEFYLRVLDGRNGTVKFQTPNTSGTLLEMPIVADVDNDGAAEIVVIRNQILDLGRFVGLSDQGIFVYGAAKGNWVNTRAIWNQHTYHVTNIREDGGVPEKETPSWTAFNLFRANLATSKPALEALPDLRPSFLRFRAEDSLVIRVGNGGAAAVSPGISVAFFVSDTNGARRFLGVTKTSLNLSPGAFQDLALRVKNLFDKQLITIIADEDSSGAHQLIECNKANNIYSSSAVFPIHLAVEIIAPDSVTTSCQDSILVVGRVSSNLPAQQIQCSINEKNAEVKNGQFSQTIALLPGTNLIRARCVALDSIVVADSVLVFRSRPPIANASGPYRGFVGDSLLFDGTQSFDPDGDSLIFRWNFGDGQVASTTRPSHTYALPGNYLITLRVEDSRGCFAFDSTQAEIQPQSVRFTATILTPSDSLKIFCRDSIFVEVTVTSQDSGFDLRQIACKINSIPAQMQEAKFLATIPLQRGTNFIVAVCQDTSGFAIVDTVTVFNLRENQPPTWRIQASKGLAEGVFEDRDSGIQQITPLSLPNARLSIDQFTPGANQVKFRIEAINPNNPFGFDLLVIDVCGNQVFFDPIFAFLEIAAGELTKSFSFVERDRYLTIENHGLQKIDIALNHHEFFLSTSPMNVNNHFTLAEFGSITFDLSKHLQPGENLLEVKFGGATGSYAILKLADAATQIDHVLDLQVIPEAFALLQNYPNPFNPSTKIRFAIPAQAGGGGIFTRLQIYNSNGQVVRRLGEGIQQPGHHEIIWDARDDHGRPVVSGVYFYRIEAGQWSGTRRMVLLQ